MKTYYIVKFNDSYGTGFDISYETLLESKEDFGTWLQQHNEKRLAEGNSDDDECEFDLIPITLFVNN